MTRTNLDAFALKSCTLLHNLVLCHPFVGGDDKIIMHQLTKDENSCIRSTKFRYRAGCAEVGMENIQNLVLAEFP